MKLEESKHIVFLCSRLDLPGGIERAVVNTANLLNRNGYKSTILILDQTPDTFYPIDNGVTVIQHPLSFGITKEGNILTRKTRMLSDVLKLKKVLKHLGADNIIATEYPFAAAAILTGIRKKSPILAWEHHHFHEIKRNVFWNSVFNYSYPRLHGIICLNADEKKYYESINPRVFVIPNFIQPNSNQSNCINKQILTIARLTDVKGIDMLVSVAKKVFNRFPDWKWKLIGTGDLQTFIRKEIDEAGLAGNIELLRPQHHEVHNEYTQASLYVMLSRNECFPMTLLEAQAAGLPCVSFDCETGPRHIIRHQVNGLLIEPGNTDQMAAAINHLLEHQHKRSEWGQNALVNSKNFSASKIFALWEAVLTSGNHA